MNFASFDFWVYLICGSVIVGIIRSILYRMKAAWIPAYDKYSLLILSLSLLYRESAFTLISFLYVAAVIWYGTQWALAREGFERKMIITGILCLALIPLVYFKYANFICRDVLRLSVNLWGSFLIPAGLSFYTFQLIGFMIDRIARNQHDTVTIGDYINFASFFPQIVAGPIERTDHLLPQVRQFSWRITQHHANEALSWIVYGLFLKLALANNIAEQSKWSGTALTNPFQIWLANFMFAYRIYFDFAGYSFVAIGLGKLFGIDLTINFKSPYTATNIQEFWRRWHITLSGWFRDYVYLPLGGGRAGKHVIRNILIVFVVSGIWHGAGWGFVLWGAFHGVLLCIFRFAKDRIKLPRALSWLICFIAVLISWLLFYERDINLLLSKLAVIFNPLTYDRQALTSALSVCPGLGNQVALALILGMSVATHLAEYTSFRRTKDYASFFLHPTATVIMAVLIIILAPTTDNGFIYFNF